MSPHLSKSARLVLIISIALCFFVAEIAVGIRTRSLALIADALHYLNDLIAFVVALVALRMNGRSDFPKAFTFGWQRASLVGAFFNGVLLLAIGLSILLQSIERFVTLREVEDPMLVVVMGTIGFTLNVVSAGLVGHDHGHHELTDGHHHAHQHDGNDADHSHDEAALVSGHTGHRHAQKTENSPRKRHLDLGMLGVLLHVMGDAFNNLLVIVAGAVIWKSKSPHRFYADPAASLAIACVVFASAIPLVRSAGTILLQRTPVDIDPDDVFHDLQQIPEVLSVHELHIWRLDQQKAVASVHVVIEQSAMDQFKKLRKVVNDCFHAYGVHSTTIQPEVADRSRASMTSFRLGHEEPPERSQDSSVRRRTCDVACGDGSCDILRCCSSL